MRNVIYQSLITPAGDSPDGDSPAVLYVTDEPNGFYIWLKSYYGQKFLGFEPERFKAIETGVDLARTYKTFPPDQLETLFIS